MSLVRSADGKIEAYVKAGIDRRLDNLFQVHHRMGTRELVREAVSSYIASHTEELRGHMIDAMGSWLSAREGWVATMLARRGSRAPGSRVDPKDL